MAKKIIITKETRIRFSIETRKLGSEIEDYFNAIEDFHFEEGSEWDLLDLQEALAEDYEDWVWEKVDGGISVCD